MHELNTPAGALKSALATLDTLAEKKAAGTHHEQWEATEAELRQVARQSTDRLHEVVARMQRFTGLDRAEVTVLDLNTLLRDVVSMLESEQQELEIELELQTVAPVQARPQQLSAVFSSLLHQAVKAVERSRSSGRLLLTTRQVDSRIEVKMDCHVLELSPQEVSSAFELVLKASGRHVSAANWSLFSSRQIIREHGGDISMESRPGQGTTITVLMPASPMQSGTRGSQPRNAPG